MEESRFSEYFTGWLDDAVDDHEHEAAEHADDGDDHAEHNEESDHLEEQTVEHEEEEEQNSEQGKLCYTFLQPLHSFDLLKKLSKI